MSAKKWREKCGCVVTDAVYKSMCATHKAEFDELHKRAQADYRAQQDHKPQKETKHA